jgi:perosamine synthetase
MVLACGAKPVFADVTGDTWLLDPLNVEKKISPRTKAIIAVHTYGNVCDMPALKKVVGGVKLIEDCAESLFSKIDGQYCGTFSDVACFSFQATKMITSGEGGMVLVGDEELLARMRLIHSHGMGRKKYWHHLVGHNFRLTNLQAALLCAQFKHRNMVINQRGVIFKRYKENLSDFTLQRFDERVAPVVWTIGIRIRDRDDVMQRLAQDGIETRPGFYAFSQQPIYGASPVGNSEDIASSVIVLPMPADIKLEEVDLVCEKLKQNVGAGWLPLEI